MYRHADVVIFVYCVHHVAVIYNCCVLHDLQFVNAGQGCRGILQSRSHDCLVSHEFTSLFVEACVRVLICCECEFCV